MELDYLLEFETAATCGSFSRTAERHNISVSALSKHMFALETAVGMRLFKRKGRGVELTRAGQRLLSCVKPVGGIKDGIQSAAAEARVRDRVSVSILSVPILAHYELSPLVASFSRINPGVEISVFENYRAVDCFLTGEYELAVTRLIPQAEDTVEYLPICADWLVLAVPEGHRLSALNAVGIEALRSEPLIINNTNIKRILEGKCAEAGFRPEYKRLTRDEVNDDTLFELVKLGAGLTVTMSRIAEHTVIPGVKIVELTPRYERNMYLARLRGRKLSSGAAAFWKYVSQHSPAGDGEL